MRIMFFFSHQNRKFNMTESPNCPIVGEEGGDRVFSEHPIDANCALCRRAENLAYTLMTAEYLVNGSNTNNRLVTASISNGIITEATSRWTILRNGSRQVTTISGGQTYRFGCLISPNLSQNYPWQYAGQHGSLSSLSQNHSIRNNMIHVTWNLFTDSSREVSHAHIDTEHLTLGNGEERAEALNRQIGDAVQQRSSVSANESLTDMMDEVDARMYGIFSQYGVWFRVPESEIPRATRVYTYDDLDVNRNFNSDGNETTATRNERNRTQHAGIGENVIRHTVSANIDIPRTVSRDLGVRDTQYSRVIDTDDHIIVNTVDYEIDTGDLSRFLRESGTGSSRAPPPSPVGDPTFTINDYIVDEEFEAQLMDFLSRENMEQMYRDSSEWEISSRDSPKTIRQNRSENCNFSQMSLPAPEIDGTTDTSTEDNTCHYCLSEVEGEMVVQENCRHISCYDCFMNHLR